MTAQPLSDTHTKGPWFARESNSRKYMSVVEFAYQSGERGSVCLVGASELDEQNANARLIAAAPDLLEALIEARDLIHVGYCEDGTRANEAERPNDGTEDFVPIHCEECRQASAAILKAQQGGE